MTIHVLCGTPEKFCTGSGTGVSKGISGGSAIKRHKLHSSGDDAFRCYKQFLINQRGCVEVGSREFRLPEGGVLVLTKKSRFGGRLRSGKTGVSGTGASRYMPRRKPYGGIML